jgi:hypothetical protein
MIAEQSEFFAAGSDKIRTIVACGIAHAIAQKKRRKPLRLFLRIQRSYVVSVRNHGYETQLP